ncbi:MAG TPA: LCP family protein [Rugosimonospora sp.]|nr:LCP family protein [Rugosimonospora sp.]
MEYASGAVLQASRGDDDPPHGWPPSGGKKRGRDPRWAQLLVIFGALLMMGAGGAIVVEKVAISEATRNIKQQDLLGDQGVQSQNKGHVTINGAKNILLVGLDNRPGQNPNDLVRADSIIVLHIAASHDRAYLISIPRDTWVHIPAFTKTKFQGQDDKINSAFAYGNTNGGGPAGGVELLAKTIKTLWNISFDAAAIVDFTGFQKVVNVLGGVCMTIDEKTISVHIGTNNKTGRYAMPYKISATTGRVEYKVPGTTPKVYEKGYQCLQPWEALDFVRQRELLPNGDYDRERHQQQFIKAIFKKILSADTLTNPIKLNKVLAVVGQSMTVSTGGISIADWAFAMRNIGANDMVTIKTNNGTFHKSTVNSGAEALDDNTLALLGAVRDDAVDQFVLDHPTLVTKS